MISIDKLYSILENGYKPAMRSQIVYMLLGSPGIGKTQIVRKFAKDKGVNVVTLLCSQQLPNEIVGTHVPDLQTGNGMKYYPPSWYFDLKDGDILFLDEMLTAPKSVLAAMLTMVESRILQNSKVLPDVMIVAAANPTGSPAQIDAAIRDRFQVVEFDNNKTVAANYLANKYGGESKYFIHIISDGQGAEWNVMTPRTVEKFIIQMESMFDKLEDVHQAQLDVFESMYGFTSVNNMISWWNERADSIRNRDYHDAVKEIQDNELETMRSQLKEATFQATVKARYGTEDWKLLDNMTPEDIDTFDVSDDLKAKLKLESVDVEMDLNSAEQAVATLEIRKFNEREIKSEIDELFEEPDLSTIIGTLEKSPYWDNIQELLSQVKLVDVEV